MYMVKITLGLRIVRLLWNQSTHGNTWRNIAVEEPMRVGFPMMLPGRTLHDDVIGVFDLGSSAEKTIWMTSLAPAKTALPRVKPSGKEGKKSALVLTTKRDCKTHC